MGRSHGSGCAGSQDAVYLVYQLVPRRAVVERAEDCVRCRCHAPSVNARHQSRDRKPGRTGVRRRLVSPPLVQQAPTPRPMSLDPDYPLPGSLTPLRSVARTAREAGWLQTSGRWLVARRRRVASATAHCPGLGQRQLRRQYRVVRPPRQHALGQGPGALRPVGRWTAHRHGRLGQHRGRRGCSEGARWENEPSETGRRHERRRQVLPAVGPARPG